MEMNAKLHELFGLIATVDPKTVANTEQFTDVVDMSKFTQVMAAALLGDMANETIDFKAYSCDSDGTNAAAITGKAITQLAASATANDNSQAAISLRPSDLLASGKRYCKFGLVTGGATGGPASVVVLGAPRLGVGADHDLSTVKQLV